MKIKLRYDSFFFYWNNCNCAFKTMSVKYCIKTLCKGFLLWLLHFYTDKMIDWYFKYGIRIFGLHIKFIIYRKWYVKDLKKYAREQLKRGIYPKQMLKAWMLEMLDYKKEVKYARNTK